MRENTKWPGMWMCRDYENPLNPAPPFSYKCYGVEFEAKGVAEFYAACAKVIQERN